LSTSNDIASLFARFGGRAENYQEIGREEKAQLSRQCWPLLASVGEAKAIHPPSVKAAGVFRRGHSVYRQPEAPASVAAPAKAVGVGPSQPEGHGRLFGGASAPAPSHHPVEARKPAREAVGTPLQQMFERLRQDGESAPAAARQKSSNQVDTLFRRLGGR